MIEIRRSLAKQFRAMARKSILAIDKHALPPILTIRSDRTGLRLQAQNTAGAIEYHEPGTLPNESYHLPFAALADFDGKKDTTIELSKSGNQVVASWQEGVVPQGRRYDQPEARSPKMPSVPEQLVTQPDHFLKAMHDANDTCAKVSETRYGTACIQLRGRPGDIIATDSRQLLRQGGFTFPWTDELLVPALPVFSARDLADSQPVAIGKTDDHVCVSAGPWKLYIAINKEARFPKADNVIPSIKSATLVHFAHDDAQFLTDTLTQLPAEDGPLSPVTIDANGQVLVRARGGNQQTPTELALVQSTTQGQPIRIAVNRVLLGRALRLGFKSLYVHTMDRPVLFHDGQRDFVTLPLGKEAVIADDKQATRLLSCPVRKSPEQAASVEPPSNGKHEAADTDTETDSTTPKPEVNGIASLIDEAESLKELLRDGYTRAHALAIAAKRYRKQARVVNSTLASLRQLQAVEA